jgi:hypothetical protein
MPDPDRAGGTAIMTAQQSASPRISEFAWGRVETADGGVFRDAKLWPGGGREWDWTETGTHHVPGIQPADVMELLDNGAETIVLSRGVYEPCSKGAASRSRSCRPSGRSSATTNWRRKARSAACSTRPADGTSAGFRQLRDLILRDGPEGPPQHEGTNVYASC